MFFCRCCYVRILPLDLLLAKYSRLNPWVQVCVETLSLAAVIISEWKYKSSTENTLKQDFRSWWILLDGKLRMSGSSGFGWDLCRWHERSWCPVNLVVGHLPQVARWVYGKAGMSWVQLSHLPIGASLLICPLLISPTALLSFWRK